MIIDWFTVIAQIVNFLILVALLRYFLFGRIRTAMRERKEQIAADLDDARKKQEQAARELKSHEAERREWEQNKDELMKEASREAADRRRQLLRQAQEEADREQARMLSSLQDRKDELARSLRLMSLEDAAGITRHVLSELSTASIEQGIVDAFIRRMKDLPRQRKDTLVRAARKAGNAMTLRSSFVLDHRQQENIAKAVEDELSGEVSLEYRHEPDLVLGIEMKIDDYKVSWSAGEFLTEVEERVSSAIRGSFGRPGEDAHV